MDPSGQQQQEAQQQPKPPRFEGVRTLSQSGSTLTQLAIDHAFNDRTVAIKYLPRGESPSFYKQLLRELLNHQQLSLW